MDRKKAVVVLVALAFGGCSRGGRDAILVGSKNFTEQVLLGEIVAQHLERRLTRPVERRLNLGGTLLAHQALVSGEIHLYPEYTGTALSAVLKQTAPNDRQAVRKRVRDEYLRLYGVEWFEPLGIDNTFAMTIPGAMAREKNLRTLSDAARLKTGWLLGVGYEFEVRSDGMPALMKTYGFHWDGRPKTMDLGLLYKAVEQKQVNMIAANSTDGMLSQMDLVVLEDDKGAFPPYEACVIARRAALESIPGLRAALEELVGKFDTASTQRMNHAVDSEHRPVSQVAREFLARALPK